MILCWSRSVCLKILSLSEQQIPKPGEQPQTLRERGASGEYDSGIVEIPWTTTLEQCLRIYQSSTEGPPTYN